ncbi:MAG: efflux RND transporter permease subunit [Bacteriovoracaceae bacterium]
MSNSSFSLASLSIKRPIFITCIIILSVTLGYLSLLKLPVDLFPNVTFPVVVVTTPYPGAGPKEVELLVSKVLEEQFSTISGVKVIRSINQEGVSIVITEFNFNIDLKHAQQQIRDKVSSALPKLPSDALPSTIRAIDPADQPIVTIAVEADLPEAALFDLANLKIKSKIEQVNQVGLVDILGGRKREIRVELDLNKMGPRDISALQVADALSEAGQNIPSGKIDINNKQESIYRTLGEFQNLSEIKNTIVSFFGNEVPTTLGDVANITDSLEDQKNIGYVNGKRSLLINVYRQSGANTVEVSRNIIVRAEKLNELLKDAPGKPKITIVRDGAIPIRDNIVDVKESIYIGIVLTIIVVFIFLASFRSTFITGLALPNSLLGAFILIAAAGFSINIMSLLALSLAVGLLVDDAIVVRENIFRHLEMGKNSKQAALDGTKEVTLAVLATTLTIIAVFGPIAFLDGVVGQFFKEFGLTICFALMISLWDALTIAPMMSAYFAGKVHDAKDQGKLVSFLNGIQDLLERVYVKILNFTLNNPLKIIFLAIFIFVFSIYTLKFVPKTFLPPQDQGEFQVNIDLLPGTSLKEMERVANEIDSLIRSHKETKISVLTVGTKDGESNKASYYVKLIPRKERKINTIQFKEMLREELKAFSYANPIVKDYDPMGGGMRPFSLNIQGTDEKEIAEIANKVYEKLKNHPSLKDVDLSYRPGKPEFQIIPDRHKAESLGVSTNTLGGELRTLMEGQTPAVFRTNGEEYDIRVRLREDQRNLKDQFNKISIPNLNYRMIPLANVAKGVETTGPANITRQDRGRYYQIGADIAPNGPGMGGAISEVKRIFSEEIKLKPDMSYSFVGQAENFQELAANMAKAAILGILFIYLVLASLYESFITPFTIMLVLPLAACGAFFGLAITGSSLDIFSMIGCIMLLGVATKNSIIFVDYTNQQTQNGMPLKEAILLAGKNRLRPILMTSFALIAGMIPIAIGLNEASKQRTSMGIAVIGGLVSSTLLTLLVVPAAYTYIERFRNFCLRIGKKFFSSEDV